MEDTIRAVSFYFVKQQAAFKILRIQVAKKEPGITGPVILNQRLPDLSTSVFWDRHVDKEIQSMQCVLFLHGSIFRISMFKLSKKIKLYKTNII